MDLWKEDAAEMDRLVLHQSEVLNIISKFEPTKFIHVYTNNGTPDCFKVELPRYRIEFELREGKLASVEHQGFDLARCQQLDDTLVEFSQYLVLEKNNAHSAEMMAQPQVLKTTNIDIDYTTKGKKGHSCYIYSLLPAFRFIDPLRLWDSGSG